MLPTLSTERTQQKFETDWTPSSTGYHSSQENVSILTPQIPTDQALVKINESLDVLQTCSGEGRSSPLTSQLETKWERVSQEEQINIFYKKGNESL